MYIKALGIRVSLNFGPAHVNTHYSFVHLTKLWNAVYTHYEIVTKSSTCHMANGMQNEYKNIPT